MDDKIAVLYNLLVDIFGNALKIEQAALNSGEFKDLSITEIHTIEAIGLHNMGMMSQIASHLKITVGTLTVTVKNLVRKGYVLRRRIEEDRRVVQILLSEKGERVYKAHDEFHREMISGMISTLDSEEEAVMIKVLESIKTYLNSKY